jgi:hypothetical protein
MVKKVLMLNLIEVTIPWENVNVELTGQVLPEITFEDTSSLVRARKKKQDKYRMIERYATLLLGKQEDEIKAKFKVDEIEIRTLYIVVSSLGVVPREKMNDFRKLKSGAGKQQKP